MSSAPMLSVVFPVYNKEKYLHKSFECLLNQTFTDSEIIVVNDGSTDKSAEIIKEYEQKCNRIKVITQENAGASAARNRGIEAATGKYIVMLDADDTIEPEMHEKMVACGEKHQADMVVCNYHIIGTGAVQESVYDYPYDEKLDREYIEKTVIPNSLCMPGKGKYINAHWVVLFKRSVIFDNNVRYNELHRKEEDKPFIMLYLKYVQSIAFVRDCLYNYHKLGNTLINQYSPRFSNLMRNFALYEELYSDIFDFSGKVWTDFFAKVYEECIEFVLIHRKSAGNVKEEIMKIITDERCINTFAKADDTHKVIKSLYAQKNYGGIYKHYMKKFRSLRLKIFLRDMLKK
ncbi:MAG: glycosyltransferase [Ruminococcus sp.]|nr:glycosyltransferase [Ruminococcus sp.]